MTRHEARQCALQALYQIDVTNGDTLDAIAYVVEDKAVSDSDLAFVRALVEGTRSHLDDLDDILKGAMERWSTERVGRVELNVLRLALYELKFDPTVPTGTILNEAVLLTKAFASEAAGKFVNGVLAKAAPIARASDTSPEIRGGETES